AHSNHTGPYSTHFSGPKQKEEPKTFTLRSSSLLPLENQGQQAGNQRKNLAAGRLSAIMRGISRRWSLERNNTREDSIGRHSAVAGRFSATTHHVLLMSCRQRTRRGAATGDFLIQTHRM
ncbi:hypothetical protein Droror1_Dr00012148, partial [Drosera rotundifolia]